MPLDPSLFHVWIAPPQWVTQKDSFIDLEKQEKLIEEIFAVDGDKEDLYEDEEDLFAPDDGAMQGDFTGDSFFCKCIFFLRLVWTSARP